MIDLSHVQAFLTVAEAGSISVAARLNGVAQSTLSRQIQALELSLEVQLFNRRGRKLSLTPAGNLFIVEGKRLLYDAQHAMSALRDLDLNGLHLRIGYVPALMHAFLADALVAYRKEWPSVTISLFEASPASQVEMLGRTLLDIACLDVAQNTRFYCENLARAPLLIATPSSNIYSRFSFNNLIEQRDAVILVPPRKDYPTFIHLVRSTCLRTGFEPVIRESQSMVSLLAEIALDVGIAILPAHWSLVPHPGVMFRSLTSGLPDNLVYGLLPSATRPQHVQSFLKVMKQFARAKYNTEFWPSDRASNMPVYARAAQNRRGFSNDRRKNDRRDSTA